MSNEITTEVLAKAIDATKNIVKVKSNGDKIKVPSLKGRYLLIHKSASNKDNQLNAMAIAPINSDGKADYDNVAVVYAGTNTWVGWEANG